MRQLLALSITLLALGCIADPRDYPYDGAARDTSYSDSGGAKDAGPPTDAKADTSDSGMMDAAPDVILPPTPTRYDCNDPGTSCEPITCEGSCEVACQRANSACAVVCDTTERCRLQCSGNVESCVMEQCDDPTPCGKGWVCNGGC